jgi:hypothetical protein
MTGLQKIAGTAIYIGNSPILYKTAYEAADFSGFSWTRIRNATNIGDLGADQEVITQRIIDANTAVYGKGGLTFPLMTNTFVPVRSDPGQASFAAAQRACKPYPFRIVWGADCEETGTVTIANGSEAAVTWNNHGFADGTPIVLSTTGALPTGLTAGTVYYVVSPDTNTFKLAATVGGEPIDTSSAGSGTHTATATPVGETDLIAGLALYGTKTGGDASATRGINMPIQPIALAVTI